jgi:hypothetical protein
MMDGGPQSFFSSWILHQRPVPIYRDDSVELRCGSGLLQRAGPIGGKPSSQA